MKAAAWRLGGSLLLACVLGAAFAAYLNPHTMLDLATRAWACF
jgi:hypothetical protein